MTVPSASRALKRAGYVLISLSVLLLDQLTKAAIEARIPLHTSVTIVDGFFDLTHVKNRGAAFGLFASIESPFRALLLNAVAFLVFVGILVYAFRSSPGSTRLQVGLALILGGAVGNLMDRVRLGSVTDFLDFSIGAYRWPAFNVADSAITIGVLLLALDIWRKPAPPSEEREAEA